MIYVSRWTVGIVVAILVLAVYLAMPNFLSPAARASLPGWMPRTPISLGLDLQGGSYLLLEVDLAGVREERMETMLGDIRARLRAVRIGYTDLNIQGNGVSVHVTDLERLPEVRGILQDIANPDGIIILGVTTNEYDIDESDNGVFTVQPTAAYERQMVRQIVSQSIEVVRRRIDELGTREPAIQAQGAERILVQVPGLSDPEQLKEILSTTARMTFHLLDETGDIAAAERGRVPPEDMLLYEERGGVQIPILIRRRVAVSGDRLVQASASFDQLTNEPAVVFRFDARGAREFGDITRTNVGRRFAIVLDGRVISAPVIREPIMGGTGNISGAMTLQEATNLAILLNAGALPAALTVLEERTVGAELGADSVNSGARAAVVGLTAVVVYLLMSYGTFGLFAAIGLTANMILLMAILTALQATLTLPGIAGIVLTIGMAVDANVLIFERIREELRLGKTVVAAIDQGFRRAMSAIIDSNLTTVLAAFILFQLGSGPVRGFAVTLGLGIIASFFSAIMVTRLVVILWLRYARPKKLVL